MSKARDRHHRVAFPVELFAEGSSSVEIPSEIHVVPICDWMRTDGFNDYRIEIDAAVIQEFIKNFNAGIRKDLRITAGHDNGMSGGELPALGWFKRLFARDDGLWATVEWTPEGETAIRNKSYKYFSPELYLNGDMAYEDPETHNVYNYVLDGGALTNFPYFKELNAVVQFSEPRLMDKFNDDMKLKDILAKSPAQLSEAEKTFLKEHKSDLSADQQSAFASVFDESGSDDTGNEDEGTEEGASGEAEGEGEGESEGEDEGDGKVEGSEGKGKGKFMSASEIATLRQQANEGAKALKKIEASERKAKIAAMTFSKQNMNGRFLPKQEGALETFMASLSEKQQDQFVNIVNNMPKADSKLFTELGDGGKEGTTAAQIYSEIKTLANEKMTADSKLSFSAALLKVYAEKPELKKAHEDALTAEGK